MTYNEINQLCLDYLLFPFRITYDFDAALNVVVYLGSHKVLAFGLTNSVSRDALIRTLININDKIAPTKLQKMFYGKCN
jgi:hypothetical protein